MGDRKRQRSLLESFKLSSSITNTTSAENVVSGESASTSVSAVTEEITRPNSTNTGEPNNKKPKHEKFLSKWNREFPWMEFNEDSGRVFCKSCKEANMKISMATVGAISLQRSTFTRHESTLEHKQAIVSKPQKGALVKNIDQMCAQVSLGEIAVFKTVYTLAKEEMPQKKFKPIMMLLKNCGNDSIKETHVNLQHQTITDIESTINESLITEIDEDVKQSPCISILIDESTDIAVHHKLIIYVRYVKESKATTRFWANLSASGECTAEVLEGILLTFLEMKGISLTKVIGLATDGAAVMMGQQNGVGKRLKERFPLLIHFHCIAHKLALAISQAANGIPKMDSTQKTLASLYSYFHSSAIRSEELRKMQGILMLDEISLKEIHHIRWLSLGRSVNVVYNSFDAIVLALTNIVACKKRAPNDKAAGLLKQCTDFGFVATIALLRDVLEIIDRTCRLFQTEDINFSVLINELNSVNVRLNRIKETPGKNLSEFLDQTSKNGYFKDIKINSHSSSVAEVQNMKTKFVDTLQSNLNSRFNLKDLDILCDLDQLLNPEALPHIRSKEASLNEIVCKLCVTDDNLYECKLPSKAGLKEEWPEIEDLLKRYKGMKMVDFCKVLITSSIDNCQLYPNFASLAQLALVLPLSTASCERGFSTQNRIKSCMRSRVSDKHLEVLTRISEEGPQFTLSNGTVNCEFDFEKAVKMWKQKKKRRLSL